jgi:hypothetical protein
MKKKQDITMPYDMKDSRQSRASHGGDREVYGLLEYEAVQCGRCLPTLWRNIVPLSSTPKMEAVFFSET